MADRYRNCNNSNIDEVLTTAAHRSAASRYRGLAGIALLTCLTVALSLYYLSSVSDDHPHGALLLAHRYSYPRRYTDDGDARTDDSGEKYLVYGRKCRIQDVDPYDEEVRAFIKTVPHVSCSKLPQLAHIIKRGGYSELHISKTATRSYSPNGVTCCYSVITRPPRDSKPDDSLAVSECHPFSGTVTNVTDEFIIVRCATKHRKKEVYKDAHAMVHVRPEVRERLDSAELVRRSSGLNQPLSVLIIGVDSVSRLNALRALPETVSVLRRHGWNELLGYNKIADNTYPNLMAVLTGIDGERSYEQCLPTQPGRLENCSLLWSKYKEHGYVTAYAEDEPNISTFNFLKVGFIHPPTDHYLRPFMLAAQRELRTTERHSLKYCLGHVSAGERVLRYAEDFATTYVNDTSFGLFWTNSFSHNDLNSPSGMDSVLARFFRRLHEQGVTERSLVVFLSDHGMRFGDVRQTKIGWLEERLPLAWLSVPRSFRRKHQLEWRALKQNTARLTTPYDLHMTLQHVLRLEESNAENEELPKSSGCPNCQSLFKPVPEDRACEDAAISPHWCVCTAFKQVDVRDSVVQAAARFVVNRVTAYVREGELAAAEGAPHKCAALTLSRIVIAQRGTSWDGSDTYYLLFVETLPGRGRYEATISVPNTSNSTTGPNFQLHSSISRLDQYAGQSRCINSAFLRKYCYCR